MIDCKKHKKRKNNFDLASGFTLIEALIVVSVLGALVTVSLNVLDPNKQKERVGDAVKVRNIEAVAEALESYRQVEFEYPPNSSITNSSSLLYEVYLDKWPGPNYEYNNMGGSVILLVPNSLGGCYRYQSDWAQVRNCPTVECDSNQSSPASNCSDL